MVTVTVAHVIGIVVHLLRIIKGVGAMIVPDHAVSHPVSINHKLIKFRSRRAIPPRQFLLFLLREG